MSEERQIGVKEAPSFSFKGTGHLEQHQDDVIAAAVKELNLANKTLNKTFQANLLLKYEHGKEMMQMQLQCERYLSEHEKEKRDGKDGSDKISLENKNAHTLLRHNLCEQTKDKDILCQELAKKRKDTQDPRLAGRHNYCCWHSPQADKYQQWAVQCPCEFGQGKFYFSNIFENNL
jgi:hypothetical protein